MGPILTQDELDDGSARTAAPPHPPETAVVTQWVLSALLVFVLAATVVWNMPDSGLRRGITPLVTPVMNATGLHQSWVVFAPDPPRLTFEIVARIDYADGTSALWRTPKGGALVGHYRTYRWRKWMESARLDSNHDLWEPAARWVARTYNHEGRTPTQVQLVRRWRELPPPGSTGHDEPGREYTFFTLSLPVGGS